MKVIMKFNQYLSLALVMIMCGCTSTQKLSDNNKKELKSFSISSDITHKNKEIYYFPPGASAAGAFGGLLGAAIHDSATKNKKKAFLNAVKSCGVNLNQELHSALKDSFLKNSRYQITENAGHKMKITVINYGFSVPNGFSSHLVPFLDVKCELFNSSGKKIWQAGHQTSIMNSKAKKFKPSEGIKDKDLIATSLRHAIKEVSEKVIAKL